MTGYDIQQRVMVLLGESRDAAASAQSMLYADHVRMTANDIARKTWSLYRTAVTDVIAGQVEYTLPDKPFRDSTFSVMGADGRVWPLNGISPEEADRRYFNWRSPDVATLWPCSRPNDYVVEGLLTYKLLPVPNYDAQDGLMVAGYFGVGRWYDINMELPLQVGCEECMELGVAWRRCREMQRLDPTYTPLMAQYRVDYITARNGLYKESLGANPVNRGGVVPSNGRYAMGGGWGWS